MTADHSFLDLIFNASLLVQFVMLILVVASISIEVSLISSAAFMAVVTAPFAVTATALVLSPAPVPAAVIVSTSRTVDVVAVSW